MSLSVSQDPDNGFVFTQTYRTTTGQSPPSWDKSVAGMDINSLLSSSKKRTSSSTKSSSRRSEGAYDVKSVYHAGVSSCRRRIRSAQCETDLGTSLRNMCSTCSSLRKFNSLSVCATMSQDGDWWSFLVVYPICWMLPREEQPKSPRITGSDSATEIQRRR